MEIRKNSKNLKEEEARENIWFVYTAANHIYTHAFGRVVDRRAFGIISGAAPLDHGHHSRTTARERHFPFELISQAPTIQIQNGYAYQEAGRIQILDAITGRTG